MSLNFCDLLVIGSDLSGVMAATLLAKRGMNVLLLDDEDETEPSPNLVTGVGSRSFKSLLGKLMIPDSKLQIFHENKVTCQVVFPRHRLDLYVARPLFLKEIEREFPEEKPVIEEILGEVDRLRENHLDEILGFFPILGGKEKKRFIKWFQNFPSEKLLSLWGQLSPTLQCFLKIRIRFLSQSVPLEPFALQLLLFLPPEGGGTFSIRGGVRELKKVFFDKLDYFGGMVHPLGNEPFQVLAKGREIRAVQLGRYNFPTRCRFLLGNTNIQSFYRQVPSPLLLSLFDRTKKKVVAMQPSEKRALVQYRIAKEILPVPMKENVVYVSDPTAPLERDNYLEINLNPLPKGQIDRFDTLMTVSYTLGNGHSTDPSFDPEIVKQLQNEIDAKLHRLIPFSNSHRERIFPGETTQKENPQLFPADNEFAMLEKIVRKRASYAPSLFFPSLGSSFKNLFLLGPNILDWLGMEGKMLAGLRAVELIWERELKVRNP